MIRNVISLFLLITALCGNPSVAADGDGDPVGYHPRCFELLGELAESRYRAQLSRKTEKDVEALLLKEDPQVLDTFVAYIDHHFQTFRDIHSNSYEYLNDVLRILKKTEPRVGKQYGREIRKLRRIAVELLYKLANGDGNSPDRVVSQEVWYARRALSAEKPELSFIEPLLAEAVSKLPQERDKNRLINTLEALSSITHDEIRPAMAKALIPELLRRVTTEKDPDIVEKASGLLSWFAADNPNAVEQYRTLLRDNSSIHNFSSIRFALERLGPDGRSLVPDLINVVQTKADQISKLNSDQLESLRQDLYAVGRFMQDEMPGEAWPDLVEPLQAILTKNKNRDLQAFASDTLAQIHSSGSVPLILQAMRDLPKDDYIYRAAFARALGNLGEAAKESLPELTTLARSLDVPRESHYRWETVEAIRKIGGEQVAQALRAEFEKHGTQRATGGARASSTPRVFIPIGAAELEKKIEAAWKKHPAFEEDGRIDIKGLTREISKDLGKVEFDTENIEYEMGFGDSARIVGYNTLPNGLSYLGVTSGGDGKVPVFFMVYWDGKQLRGYVPTEGNPWNTKTKKAYGNDEEADAANLKDRYPDLFRDTPEEEIATSDSRIDFDQDKILKDIERRFAKKGN